MSKSVIFCYHCFISVRLFYSHVNPFLGLHLFKMTKLIQQVSDETSHLQESMKLLDRVSNMYIICMYNILMNLLFIITGNWYIEYYTWK